MTTNCIYFYVMRLSWEEMRNFYLVAYCVKILHCSFSIKIFMFMKFAKSLSPVVTQGIKAHTSKSFGRLFSTTNIPIPHSTEHLKLQQKLFKLDNTPATIKTLPTSTKLVGLNVTPVKPCFLGTAPVYDPEILNALSLREKQEWLEIAEKYYGQIGHYELLCDVDCVTSSSDNGVPIYYLDHSLLEPTSYTSIKKALDLDTIAQIITHTKR
ncbi:hypothetical protein Loa_02173 [Legionella oakridgensis ATCC 33761 = DSM 21215]|uniref:Uncharacterized protein n=4 Tax=Legionella oakridgensis TaxID=29423 RepID=W0BCX0_9GAMM|nr:hypothetical protein Loa_02173 [Legionella oakridgensis ATCC 33761 = DSM 21215]KTD36953.1 hypothetical protein Loak_2089 [Legionella oakridgensis]STY20738.1 Uncharacterised protein [Legionella longbeachae]